MKKSFTLVELMIVIAILAILVAIVIFTLNPSRLFDNFRDSRRVSDIVTINKAINFMETWNSNGINYGNSMTVYLSLPDSSSTCSSYTLPTLATGYSYSCKPSNVYRNTDSTGWIPLDFTISSSNKYINILPIDPTNDSTYFYSYFPGGSYELIARLKNSNTNSTSDNGFYDDAYELGSPNRTNFTPVPKNLILNGNAETTIGWTGVSSLSTDAYEGQYSFRIDGYHNVVQTKAFKVDPNKRYKMSICLKSVGSGGLSYYLFGIHFYDKLNREISCKMNNHNVNTKTTLAQPLNSGDTIVYLNSTANWNITYPYIGFYPFEDYPDYTYTRNVYQFNSIDTENNSITLSSSYTGDTFPSETKAVNLTSSNCALMYPHALNNVPNTWGCYSWEVFGQPSLSNSNKIFRYGTATMKLVLLCNYVQSDDRSLLIDDLKIELISNQ